MPCRVVTPALIAGSKDRRVSVVGGEPAFAAEISCRVASRLARDFEPNWRELQPAGKCELVVVRGGRFCGGEDEELGGGALAEEDFECMSRMIDGGRGISRHGLSSIPWRNRMVSFNFVSSRLQLNPAA